MTDARFNSRFDTQANATYQEGNAHLPSIPTGGTIRKTPLRSYEKVYCSPSASSATALVNNRQHQDRHISQVSRNFQKPSHKRASMAPCAFLISRILVCTARSHWSCKTCTAGTTTFVSFPFSTILMCYKHAGVRQEALESTRQLMTYRSKSMKQLVTGHPSEQKGP